MLLLFSHGAVAALPKTAGWDAFAPPEDTEYDWIQMTSGEWLKGDFKVMYDYVVEFDSDELGLLELDLGDVKQLRTRNPQMIRIERGWGSKKESQYRGKLTIHDGDVILANGEDEQRFKRRELVAIADGVERERDFWSGSFSVGINARGGNSETIDSNFMATLKRRRAASRFIADYVGNFSEAGEQETANNHRLNGTYDWFIATQLFWRILGAEYYRDPFSNIDNQYSLGTAIGYDILNSPKAEWEVSLGGGYQNQQFVSVQPTEDEQVDTPFLIASTRYDTEINSRVDFLLDYSLRVLNERSGTFTHHALAKVSTEFIGDLDIDISMIWDHTQTPQENADGLVPKQNDYQLVFSLAYDF
jgi:putative salt-induced outer membrane protein YdiY